MKQFRSWWTVLPVSALVLSGCNEKKVEAVKQAAEQKLDAVVEKVTDEVASIKGLSAGERASFLGIVGHLSRDTESLMSVIDAKEIVSRLRSLKTWGFIRATAKAEAGEDPEDSIAEGAAEASKFLGQEFFLATGKNTATQFSNLLKVNQKSTYLQFRMLANGFAKGAVAGEVDPSAFQNTEQLAQMQEAFKDMLKDSAMLDSIQFPPLLAGVKAADQESLNLASTQISSALANVAQMGGPAVTPLSFTKGGVEFKGYKVAGSGFAEPLEQARAEMEQTMDPADVTRIIEAVKKKSIVVAVGSLDSYLMVYIGDSEESCPLVDKVEDSLAAKSDLSFVDNFSGKKVVGVLYADESLVKSCIVPSLKPIVEGIRDGISGVEGFGETRDLAAILDTVAEKEAALLALASPAASGGLVVLEDGVKFEFFGGDQGVLDYDASHKVGTLTPDEDTLAVGNWVANEKYSTASAEAVEALVETAYAFATKASTLDVKDSEEFDQFKGMFGIFNEKFRPDLLNLFGGLKGAGSGLGQESAFVVDMKGVLPAIPGIPQELINEGRSFRISSITPVTDRSKLSDGWTKIYSSATNILKTVSEMSGTQIPMLQPTSSEKNDLITWSFPLPLVNEDSNPSVTVSDKWFVTSTSKKQAQDLIIAADASKNDRKGAWMELNFKALNKGVRQWVDLVDKYGDKLIPDADKLAAFREKLPTIREGLAAAAEWDKLDCYSRKEGGKIHSTLHIKVN